MSNILDSLISYEQLKEAYEIAALTVSKYGDAYLPIFERLHREIQNYEYKQQIRVVALEVAHSKAKQ